ncbi:hypothetical protein V6N13_075024 [Hibiscus sabdariffa]
MQSSRAWNMEDLCTLEFETRRASYYWLLHVLDLYQPYVWEYSRLNVTNTVMSKRKLNYIVTNKYVDGWDDPRLMTLAGLRRRGVTSTAINCFVRGIGITRSDCSMIRLDRLEYHIREELNKTAPRVLVVLHPLKVIIYSSSLDSFFKTVVITNLEAGSILDLDAKKWPDAQADDTSAFYKVPFLNVVYIERSDFRMKDSKDYYGLAPGKSALLRYAFPIKCTDVILADDKETVLEIRAEYDPSKKNKPKNPAELDDWLADLNPNSKVVVPAAYEVPSLRNAVVGDTFQFERLEEKEHSYGSLKIIMSLLQYPIRVWENNECLTQARHSICHTVTLPNVRTLYCRVKSLILLRVAPWASEFDLRIACTAILLPFSNTT